MLEAELARALGERKGQERQHAGAGLDELGRERHHLARPGLERRRVGDAGGDAAERGVALPERGPVGSGEVGPGRQRADEGPVEVRATRSRAALHDREPVGREHERVDARAELLRRGDGGAVHADALGLAHREPHLGLDGHVSAPAGDAREPFRRALADELHVLPGPEREPLGRDVHGLEQVRLPRPVRPGHEDEPWLERELEPFVRADVAERHLGHDQAVLLSSRAVPRERRVA